MIQPGPPWRGKSPSDVDPGGEYYGVTRCCTWNWNLPVFLSSSHLKSRSFNIDKYLKRSLSECLQQVRNFEVAPYLERLAVFLADEVSVVCHAGE